MKKQTLLTPVDLSNAESLGGRIFLKQVLPITEINYKGRKITFDKGYITDLAKSFKRRAYDQVPLVFADEENRHNMDPKRFGGEILDFVAQPDGLWAKIRANKETAKILDNNPRLGVSARIVEGLEKSDGRVFPRAIQHVLLTMDPRISGMKPWQTVDLTGYTGATHRVVDLTALTYEKGSEMPKIDKKGGSQVKASAAKTERKPDANGILDLSDLSDGDLDILLSATTLERPKTRRKAKDRANVESSVEDDIEDEDLDDEDLDEDAEVDEADLDPEDFEDDEDPEDDEEVEDDAAAEGDVQPVSLRERVEAERQRRRAARKPQIAGRKGRKDLATGKKGGGKRRIDLAEAAIDSTTRDTVSQMQIDLAEERWENQRREFVRSGVPPFLLDLAAPVLSSPEAAVIDLSSSDEPVNATEIVRSLINGVKGLVDLTPELGHKIDLAEDSEAEDTLLKAWDNEYGVR